MTDEYKPRYYLHREEWESPSHWRLRDGRDDRAVVILPTSQAEHFLVVLNEADKERQALEARVRDLEGRFQEVESRQEHRFQLLEDRLLGVENQIPTTEERIRALAGRVRELDTRTSGLIRMR